MPSRILHAMVAGCTAFLSAVATDKHPDSFRQLSGMGKPRADHTSTLLRDGRVLLAGGMVENGVFLSEAEVYDPSTEAFSPIRKMAHPRVGHSATLLANGTVWIAGGLQGQRSGSDTEFFNPVENSFVPGPRLLTDRYGQSAVMLPSGNVLITGGAGLDETALASTEIFNPGTRRISAAPPMATARMSAAAALLQDGDVLICGGMNGRREILATCERFEAKTSRWRPSGSLTLPRVKHDMVTLEDGRVLVIGGASSTDWKHQHDTAEISDAEGQRFTATLKMNHPRFKLPETSILLANGSVLVSGGSDRLELFNPGSRTFVDVRGALPHPVYYARATRLKGGDVLITGGYGNGTRDNGPIAGNLAWRYSPGH